MKRILAVILSVVMTALPMNADTIHPPKGFIGKLYTGTLALYVEEDGKSEFLCTAWPFEKISGGYNLISAGHCIQEMDQNVSFFVSEVIGGPLTPVIVRKVYEGDGIDVSEFELKTTKNYFVFPLGDENSLRIGDKVINPNFSLGLAKQLSVGIVSSGPLIKSEYCSSPCVGDFIIQTYAANGSSGSAVISEKTHKVVGILIFGFNDEIGYGIEPVSKIRKFLAGPNQPHPLPRQGEHDDPDEP